MQPILIMMTGLPGSGKSTWVNNFMNKAIEPFKVISSDNIIQAFADDNKMTYNDAYKVKSIEANQIIWDEAYKALTNNSSVIWDQTNLSAKKRAKILKYFKNYFKINICFEIHNDVFNQDRYGKFIPELVLKQMIESFEEPLHEEGFDVIEFHNWRNNNA